MRSQGGLGAMWTKRAQKRAAPVLLVITDLIGTVTQVK
jgi:hypothetical protein